jgi:hypothetical protein
MMSPGSSVMPAESSAIRRGSLKYMWRVLESCLTTPFTRQVTRRSSDVEAVGGHDARAHRAGAVEALALVPLAAVAALQSRHETSLMTV